MSKRRLSKLSENEKKEKNYMVEVEVSGFAYYKEKAESEDKAVEQAEKRKMKFPENVDDTDIEVSATDVWEIKEGSEYEHRT